MNTHSVHSLFHWWHSFTFLAQGKWRKYLPGATSVYLACHFSSFQTVVPGFLRIYELSVKVNYS